MYHLFFLVCVGSLFIWSISLTFSGKYRFVSVDIVCLQKKSVYMLPFLVLGLIGIVVLMAFVVIGGIVLTVINWRIGLIILIVGFAALGKCY
jgi:hypothetical protein